MSIEDILTVLTPLTVLTMLLSGLAVGFIYIRNVNTSRAFGYHNIVLTAAFFISLSLGRYIEGENIWEHWLAGFILYIIYITAVIVGKNIKVRAVKTIG